MIKKNNNIIKVLNDLLDEIIDKSKSFEDQIKSIKKVENLNVYCSINNYGDKALEFEIFKLKLADLSNIIERKIFKQIFSHTFETLANKLINTTNKEEKQIIVKTIGKNKNKLFEKDEFNDFLIQPQQRADLKYTIDFILGFNKELK